MFSLNNNGYAILIILLLGAVFFLSDAFAASSNMIVQSCAVRSSSGTIFNCLGLNTLDNNTDVSLVKNGIVGLTLSNPTVTGPINFVQATVRHGGQTGIGGTIGVTFWDANASVAFCTQQTFPIPNSVSFVTRNVKACTPSGGWTNTKLNNLELRIQNKDTGGSQNLYLAYVNVNVDYNTVCGNGIVEFGEVCDGGSQACTTSGGYAGSQSCNSTCSGWNTCTSGQFCGDGIINGPEVCDTNNLAGYTCMDFNYSGGSLGCWYNCLSFDVNGCF